MEMHRAAVNFEEPHRCAEVAHLRVSKLPLDHPEGMLHLGTNARLDLLHLVYQRVNQVVLFVQCSALAWTHRDVPGDVLPHFVPVLISPCEHENTREIGAQCVPNCFLTQYQKGHK